MRVGDAPVRFVHSTFEDWTPEGGPFGLISCAQAWHWVDPQIGFAKAAALLADGGVLAVFGNEDVEVPAVIRPAFDALRARMQQAPGVRYGGGVYQPGKLMDQLLRAAPQFDPPNHRVYERAITYTPDSYTRLNATYSDVQTQPAELRAELLSELHAALSALGASFEVKVETHLYWMRPRA